MIHENQRRHVLTVHGFGETAYAKGLYSEIAANFSPLNTFHILDFYNEKPNGDRMVPSINKQVAILEQKIESFPDDDYVTVLAKSGGSRMPLSMDESHIDRVNKFVFLVPPGNGGQVVAKDQLTQWGGNEQLDGSWMVPRKKGGHLIVDKQYVKDIGRTELMEKYKTIAKSHAGRMFIIRAMKDEIREPLDVTGIDGARTIDIDNADHHFTGESRAELIHVLAMHAVLIG